MSLDRPQEQYDQRDHPERVEDEKGGAPTQDAERHAGTATALPEGEGAGPEATTSEQPTVSADQDAGPSPGPALPGEASSARGDFQVFGPGELEAYRSRWESIQLGFLDDPAGAAEQADAVVGELLGHLSERREALRDELNRRSNQDLDTESMRLAVRNYRSLFQRLVGS